MSFFTILTNPVALEYCDHKSDADLLKTSIDKEGLKQLTQLALSMVAAVKYSKLEISSR
jgi:hypothetical protein